MTNLLNNDSIYVSNAINDKLTGLCIAHIVDDNCNEYIYIGINAYYVPGYYNPNEFVNGSITEYNNSVYESFLDRYKNIANVLFIGTKHRNYFK